MERTPGAKVSVTLSGEATGPSARLSSWLGGFRPHLRQGVEGGAAQPSGLHGAAWTSGTGPGGEEPSALSQCSHAGPAAQAHQDHRGQPSQAKAKTVHGSPDTGAHLQRLEPATAGLPGNRSGSSLRGIPLRVLHPQPGSDGHLHRLDGGRSPVAREQSLVIDGLEAIAR